MRGAGAPPACPPVRRQLRASCPSRWSHPGSHACNAALPTQTLSLDRHSDWLAGGSEFDAERAPQIGEHFALELLGIGQVVGLHQAAGAWQEEAGGGEKAG